MKVPEWAKNSMESVKMSFKGTVTKIQKSQTYMSVVVVLKSLASLVAVDAVLQYTTPRLHSVTIWYAKPMINTTPTITTIEIRVLWKNFFLVGVQLILRRVK